MLAKTIGVLMVMAIAVMFFIVTATSPSGVGPFGILVLFISMYVTMFGFMTFSIYGLSHLAARLSKTARLSKPLQAMPLKESYYYGTITALGPVMLIGMQSVGGVGVYEFGLIVIFTTLGCVYISKKMH